MTDNELRELMSVDVKKGSEALYKQYSQYIYAIVFRILRDCGSREDVEDCFAETFAEIIRRFDNIHGTTLKSYIGKAAQNRALNYRTSLRKNQVNTVPFELTEEPVTDNLQEQQEKRAKFNFLLEKIKELGEPDATIVVQKYYFGRKMAEIAEMTGLKPHAAQVRCGRALKKLRKDMEQWR